MSETEEHSVQQKIDQLISENRHLQLRVTQLEEQIQTIQEVLKPDSIQTSQNVAPSNIPIQKESSQKTMLEQIRELKSREEAPVSSASDRESESENSESINTSSDELQCFPSEENAEQLLEDVQEILIHTDEKPIKKNLEANIGKFWFNRIGIVVLIFGLGSLMVYAIQNDFLTPKTQLLLGILTSLSLIVAGEITSKVPKYHHWARNLIGGGLAFLYFIAYAAYHFSYYQQVTNLSQVTDIILLTIIVIVAVGIAFRHDSMVIISGAFFMGFHTTFLSRGVGSLSLIYGIILTLGLLSAVSYKKWVNLTIGGVFASYIVLAVWIEKNPNQLHLSLLTLLSYFTLYSLQLPLTTGEHQKENLKSFVANILNILFFWGLTWWVYIAQHEGPDFLSEQAMYGFYLIAYWLIFNAITLAIPRKNNLLLQKFSVVILALNIICYSFLSLPFFLEYYPEYKVIVPLGLSIIYLFGYLWTRSLERYELISQACIYLSVLFLTSTIALQFKEENMTFLWAFEAVILRAMANKLQLKSLKYSFYLVNVLTIGKLGLDFIFLLLSGKPALSHIQLLGYSMSCASLYLSIWLINQDNEQNERADLLKRFFKLNNPTQFKPVIIDFNCWAGTLGFYCVLELWLPSNALPFGWCGLIALNLFIAQFWNISTLRYTSYVINLLVIGRVILFELGMEMTPITNHPVELTYFILSISSTYFMSGYLKYFHREQWLIHINSWAGPLGFVLLFQQWLPDTYLTLGWLAVTLLSAGLGLAFKLTSYRLTSYVIFLMMTEHVFTHIHDMAIILRVLTLSALIISAYGLTYSYEQKKTILLKEEKHVPLIHLWLGAWFALFWIAIEFTSYGISVGWGVFAISTVLLGFTLNYQPLRIQGLILVGITMVKVFLYDTSSLETIYKIISYICLGCILLAASFIYTRYQDKINL